jgi:hypothetical protein
MQAQTRSTHTQNNNNNNNNSSSSNNTRNCMGHTPALSQLKQHIVETPFLATASEVTLHSKKASQQLHQSVPVHADGTLRPPLCKGPQRLGQGLELRQLASRNGLLSRV